MPAPSSPERAAALAALNALLDSVLEPVVIIVKDRKGELATLRVDPPATAVPSPATLPRDDDERDCRADILEALRAAGRRLTTNQLLSEMERRNCLWGETTVKRHLAGMMSDGVLSNDSRARPPGYAPGT